MTSAAVTTTASLPPAPGDAALATALAREIEGDVLFSAFDRGRYATDASIYQVEPIGVIRPRRTEDVGAALAIARDRGVSLLPRGGGTSQSGQTVGRSLVVDTSRYLTGLAELDLDAGTVWVEPGLVLDDLNRRLRPHGWQFPVDISTASRATIGGMAANNSCGSRSLRYGVMVDNVLAIDALLPGGERARFEEVPANRGDLRPESYARIVEDMSDLARREADEIATRFPRTARRVGGYNLDRVAPRGPFNMAGLLVGSEGTLAYFERVKLRLSRLPGRRVLGVCHFRSFRQAMESAQHIVALGPTAVELVDRTILDLAQAIPAFAESMPRFVRGAPESLLLVEFAGDAAETDLVRRLDDLTVMLRDRGLCDTVVRALDPALQSEVWDIRAAGLNIAMSMKGDGKPVSFIEDCAVPLDRLADYTERLDAVFARHGTSATWYAHASVGCLHVRPILNLKEERGVTAMRAIAEDAFAFVREYGGAHSGEHGDGIVRSEFHEAMFGPRLTRAFETVKDRFDPAGVMNTAPSKIVRAPRMDDRALLRYPPDYRDSGPAPVLDWSAWGGLLGAVEMCNNNGTCRKRASGVMCPSFRVTGDETHVTRGRANALRLALSGQLGPDALMSEAMSESLSLCVGCKACRRECPTGVDMARLKIEVTAQRRRRHGTALRDRLVAHLPRYAPVVHRFGALAGLRDRVPGGARLAERWLGISARRSLPRLRTDAWRDDEAATGAGRASGGREAVLFVDTFNRWLEPENARAALRVLTAAGFTMRPLPAPEGRPLCCGRTYLAAGMVEAAREEARRTVAALRPLAEAGVAIVGLEPSCLLTLRDEHGALLPADTVAPVAGMARLFGEVLAGEAAAGTLELTLTEITARAHVHGHCHQKAFGLMGSVTDTLRLVPGLDVRPIESSCCGMAGAFGYEAEHYGVSMAMAELSLLPAVRAAAPADLIVADGTSCRHQIADGTGREAVHSARVLAEALAGPSR